MSALNFDATLNASQLYKELDQMNRKIKGMTQDITKEGQNIDNVFKKVGAGFATYFTTQAIGNVLTEMVSVRGEFQKFEAVLTNTLNGDNVKANGLLDMISNFAANTPFQLTEITDGFIKLANQGVMQTSSELTKLGDFAAVTGKPIGQLYEAILDINNPERWKEFGARVTTEGEKVAISFRGQKVEFDRTVEGAKNAIAQLGSMDGVAGTMSVISKTLVGQISNLQDAWDQMLNKLGQSNEGVFSGMITGATSLVQNYERVLEIIGAMVGVFGAAKVAAIVYNMVMAEQAAVTGLVATSGVTMTRTMALQELWTKRVAAAQSALNKSMLANPYVLAAAAIVGLVAGLVILNRRFEESIDAKRRYDEQTKALDEGYKARIDNANGLIETLKSETAAEAKRVEALRQLQELYPEIFKNIDIHNAKLGITVETTKQLAEAEEKKKLEEVRRDIAELSKQRAKIEALRNRDGTTTDMGGEGISWVDEKRLAQLNKEIQMKGEREVQMIIDQTNAEQAKQKEVSKTIKERIKEADSIKKLEELQKQWKANFESATTATDRSKYAAELKQIEAALNSMNGKTDKEKEKVDQLKAAQEALTKAIQSGDKAAIEAAAKRVDALEKQKRSLEEIEQLELQKAWRDQFDGQKMETISTSGPKPIIEVGSRKTVKGIQYEVTAIDKSGPVWKKVKLENKELQKSISDGAKKADKEQKKFDEDEAERKKKNFENLLDYSRQFTGELIDQLGLSEEQATQMQTMADIAVNIAKGDYLAAAFSAASLLMNEMFDLFGKNKELLSDYYKEVETNIKNLTQSIDVMSEALGNVGSGTSLSGFNLMQSQLVRLKNDAARLNEQLIIVADAEGRRGGGSTGTVTTTNKELQAYHERSRITVDLIAQSEALKEEIELLSEKLLNPNLTSDQRDAIIALLNSYNDVVSAINSITQDTIGTSVDDLTKSLTDAFMAGEDAAEKWGEKVDEIIKNIVGKQLTAKLLSEPITAAINALVKDQTDGLDEIEAKKFKDAITSIYTTVSPAYQAALDAMKLQGIDLASAGETATDKSLTGAVKGITSDEAGLIAGQLMRFADYQFKGFMQGTEMLNAVNMQTQHLSEIAKNTKNNTELPTMRMELEKMTKILTERL